MNPRFHIDRAREADDGLTEAAYMRVREGIRGTQSERIITYMLGDDPLLNGQPLPEGLHKLVVSPLVAYYQVFEASMAVRVGRIGFFPV